MFFLFAAFDAIFLYPHTLPEALCELLEVPGAYADLLENDLWIAEFVAFGVVQWSLKATYFVLLAAFDAVFRYPHTLPEALYELLEGPDAYAALLENNLWIAELGAFGVVQWSQKATYSVVLALFDAIFFYALQQGMPSNVGPLVSANLQLLYR